MPAELVVVGGGRMGEALVRGLLGSGALAAGAVAVVEVDPARRRSLEAEEGLLGRCPGLAIGASLADVDLAGGFGAVIAVKPADITGACAEIAAAGPSRVLSIAAGVTIAALHAALSGPGRHPLPAVLRAMPNTPALVGAGASGLSPAPGCGADDVAWAREILAAVGLVVEVEEGLLDAVTGLSGSGPAYAFLVAEALIDAGVLVGLPRPLAEALTVQTLLGAARMLAESGEGPGALRAAVTSPGGTTASGLRALEQRGLRAALADAVVAATERSRQLGA